MVAAGAIGFYASTMSIPRLVVLGAIVGLSFCMMFETGIYIAAACAASVFVILIRQQEGAGMRLALIHVVVMAAVACATFFGVCFVLYGAGVFSYDFYRDLTLPMLIYGRVMWGLEYIDWSLGWNLVTNIAVPAVALASIPVLALGLQNDPLERSPERAVLIFLAVVGCLMLFKWVNRSLLAVWHQNALPHLILVAWWCRCLINSGILPRWGQAAAVPARLLVAGAAMAYVSLVSDPKQPTIPHGLQAYLRYPSVALARVREYPIHTWKGDDAIVPAKDVEFIKRVTSATERVAIVSPVDWVFLLKAQRAPKFVFVPSGSTFVTWHLERSLAGVDKILVDERFTVGYPWVQERIKQALADDFRMVGRGEALVLHVKK
jgi:hypothetical protein